MIDLAQRLAADTDFVRVDLYLLTDRIVLGELTNYPAGGDSPFIGTRSSGGRGPFRGGTGEPVQPTKPSYDHGRLAQESRSVRRLSGL